MNLFPRLRYPIAEQRRRSNCRGKGEPAPGLKLSWHANRGSSLHRRQPGGDNVDCLFVIVEFFLVLTTLLVSLVTPS